VCSVPQRSLSALSKRRSQGCYQIYMACEYIVFAFTSHEEQASSSEGRCMDSGSTHRVCKRNLRAAPPTNLNLTREESSLRLSRWFGAASSTALEGVHAWRLSCAEDMGNEGRCAQCHAASEAVCGVKIIKKKNRSDITPHPGGHRPQGYRQPK